MSVPGTSPLLHAPSFAQHRFVALMALWFLVALAKSIGDFWALGEAWGLLSALATAGMVGLQIAAQASLVGWVTRWRAPGWVKFSGAAGVATGLLLLFHAGVALTGDGGSSILPFRSRLAALFQGTSLLAWYTVWWGSLRLGWVDASTAITAAGVHGVALGAFWGWPPEPGLEWLWAAPLRFFVGWSLMFLPGAIAAHEGRFPLYADRLGGRRAVACVVPAVAASIPAVCIAWFMAAAHR